MKTKYEQHCGQFGENPENNEIIQSAAAQNEDNENGIGGQDLVDASGYNRMHITHFGVKKAGMTDATDAKLNSIMERTNQTNEKYFSKQKAKLSNQDEKIKAYIIKIDQYRSNVNLWAKTEKEVKRRIKVFEEDRSLERTWIHVDMDMFYAACEIRDRPDLIDHPVAIGDYSMIQTTNYVARKFGVRAAMPGFLGKQMCPHLVFIRANKEKYTRISDYEFMYLLKNFDERLESQGLDEANLDVTDYLIENGLNSPEGRMFLG